MLLTASCLQYILPACRRVATICHNIARPVFELTAIYFRSYPPEQSHVRVPTSHARFSYSSSAKQISSKIDDMANNVIYLGAPDKSECDKKEYKILQLQNGLRVMLVSDPSTIVDDSSDDSCTDDDESSAASEEESPTSTASECGSSSDDLEDCEGDEKLAACALTIGAGSFSDPREIQGLAHFVEHMIFMGSAKYPCENDFDAYIKKSGGFDNADTDCEETNFYFEIAEKHLDGALDRFANLFIEPLMKKEAITREREAVESEFQSKMSDDDVRRDQLLASLGQDGHPSSIFTWGNLKTLKETISEDELYRRVHEFRKRYYSSHRMFLCVQARLPLEELEGMVLQKFSAIPNNSLPGDDMSSYTYKNAFKDEFYENVYFVKPVSDICRLEIMWCLPSLTKEYRCKPHEYIAYLVGYEGKGSLCAYLRKKLWALDLVAGIDDSGFEYNSIYSLFRISFILTEKGYQHIPEILSATFYYLKLLNKNAVSTALFSEIQSIEANLFRFQMEQCAFDNVQDWVLNLKYYPPQYVLNGAELYFEFDGDAIQKILDHLNNDKFNIMIASAVEYDGIKYDQLEKWFGTEYASIKIPNEWINYRHLEDFNSLHLPEPNIFIASDFSLAWNSSLGPLPLYPSKVIDSNMCEAWFKQDDKFLLPISYAYFYLMSPLPLMSPRNAALMALYSLVLKYQLVEELYPATVAGLSHQCYPSEKGLILKVSGYSEKLQVIVDIITKRMSNIIELTSEHLDVLLKQQKRNYYNYFIKPKSLNKDIRLGILETPRWSSFEKYNSLQNVTMADVLKFSNEFTSKLKIQMLIQGNLTEKQAVTLATTVLLNLKCDAVDFPKALKTHTTCLPNGSNYVRCKSFCQTDSNTVITNFYQIGMSTIRDECLLDLLMMIVEEPLFDILRTKEQLAYDVSASVRNNNSILGYSITLNSQENKFTAEYVEKRIEAFRHGVYAILQNLSQEDFEHNLESLIKTKLVIDDALKDEISRNWEEITCEEYIFDRQKQEAECLRQFTKDTLLEFCTRTEAESFKKLSVQIIGNKVKDSADERQIKDDDVFLPEYLLDDSMISDISAFKSSLPLYPSKNP